MEGTIFEAELQSREVDQISPRNLRGNILNTAQVYSVYPDNTPLYGVLWCEILLVLLVLDKWRHSDGHSSSGHRLDLPILEI